MMSIKIDIHLLLEFGSMVHFCKNEINQIGPKFVRFLS